MRHLVPESLLHASTPMHRPIAYATPATLPYNFFCWRTRGTVTPPLLSRHIHFRVRSSVRVYLAPHRGFKCASRTGPYPASATRTQSPIPTDTQHPALLRAATVVVGTATCQHTLAQRMSWLTSWLGGGHGRQVCQAGLGESWALRLGNQLGRGGMGSVGTLAWLSRGVRMAWLVVGIRGIDLSVAGFSLPVWEGLPSSWTWLRVSR